MIASFRLLVRLMAPWRPWAGRIALSIVVALAVTLANVALTAVSGWFVTAMAVAGASGASMNYFTPAAIIRALAIVRTGGRWVERVVGHEATFRLIAAMRVDLFASLERIAPGGLADLRSGDVAARLKGDVDRLEPVFLRLVSPLLVALATTALVAAVLARFDGGFAAIFLIAVGLGGLAGPLLAARAAAVASAATTATAAALRVRLVDDLEGAAALIVAGAATETIDSLVARHDALLAAEATTARAGALAQAGLGLAADLTVVGVVALGGSRVAADGLAGPDWALAVLLALAAFEAFAAVPNAFVGLPATLASARRIFETTDRAAPVSDPHDPVATPPGRRLEIVGVGLTRPGAARPALAGLDLTIEPGERVAVIGASGAGKSSLFELLVRFRDPTAGEIRLDGVPLTDLALEGVRSRIVLVGQDPHLFSTTVADNLRLAAPEASDAALWSVLADLGLAARVEALPEGLATPIGTAGAKLSGGEARRLAVARALLCAAPIQLFDEPTEGLDPETAETVIDAILARSAGRTVIVATHLPIALARMDRVVELDAGRLVPGRMRRISAVSGGGTVGIDAVVEDQL